MKCWEKSRRSAGKFHSLLAERSSCNTSYLLPVGMSVSWFRNLFSEWALLREPRSSDKSSIKQTLLLFGSTLDSVGRGDDRNKESSQHSHCKAGNYSTEVHMGGWSSCYEAQRCVPSTALLKMDADSVSGTLGRSHKTMDQSLLFSDAQGRTGRLLKGSDWW